jgi:branched-chain amino acid transport system permease protein
MKPDRSKDLTLDLCGVGFMALSLLVPFVTGNPLALSLTHQIVIGITAALAVYIMLRMDLMAFTVPAFMAIGGYTGAMLADVGITNLFVLIAAALVTPVLLSIPLGAIVLRLKGVYFVFITFITNEILQLLIFETPDLTGGSTGMTGVPPATLFGIDLSTPRLLALVTAFIGLVAVLITLGVTHRFRPEFSSIEENETLAESLGVRVWWYRTIGFMACSGVSGLAGFALVNMLSTAHPSSFASFSAVNYIAYAFIGGRGTILGAVVGGALLVWLSNIFSSHGQLAVGLFGVLLIVSVMIAPGGLVGLCRQIASVLRDRKQTSRS